MFLGLVLLVVVLAQPVVDLTKVVVVWLSLAVVIVIVMWVGWWMWVERCGRGVRRSRDVDVCVCCWGGGCILLLCASIESII